MKNLFIDILYLCSGLVFILGFICIVIILSLPCIFLERHDHSFLAMLYTLIIVVFGEVLSIILSNPRNECPRKTLD